MKIRRKYTVKGICPYKDTVFKKIRSETMHSSGARMQVKTQPDLVGQRENAVRACSPTFPNRITGWKPPARAPASQLGALFWWTRVDCMHSARTPIHSYQYHTFFSQLYRYSSYRWPASRIVYLCLTTSSKQYCCCGVGVSAKSTSAALWMPWAVRPYHYNTFSVVCTASFVFVTLLRVI